MSLQEFTQRFYQLTPKPKMVFILLMEGKDDSEIGRAITAKETTVRKHIQNLCDHFAIAVEAGEGKQQRRLRLLEQGRGYLGPLLQVSSEITPAILEAESSWSKQTEEPERSEQSALLETVLEIVSETEKNNSSLRYENWDGAANLPQMLGRQTEMATLENWLTQERSRLVSLIGLKGSGKTTFGVKVAQIAKIDFTVLRWRSLSSGPSLMQLLDDWTNEIVPHRSFSLVASLGEQISQFLKVLKEHRCLLILDDFETLLQPQQLAGTFQSIYQDYEQFLRRVSEENHQSCIFIISQEKPKSLSLWEGAKLPVRSLSLGGLAKDAKILLKNQGMKQEKSWDLLINQCGDYPLNLISVTTIIQDLFGGDVAQFLAFSPNGMIEENWQLINTQLARLSSLEWDLLYPLALSSTAFSLSDFKSYYSGSEMLLLTIVKSLHDRLILSQQSGKFSLSFALRYGVITAIAKVILAEIYAFQVNQDINQFKMLKQYSFAEKLSPKKAITTSFCQIWDHLAADNQKAIALQLQKIQQYLTDFLETQKDLPISESCNILKNNLNYLISVGVTDK